MTLLIDSALWVDFSRARSSRTLKEFIAPYILDDDAAVTEPIIFEVLRHASDEEARMLAAQFQTMPTLPAPNTLWEDATRLGQTCRRKGTSAGSLDLLIVAIAIHHDAELVTFDRDFELIGKTCKANVNVLRRPTA